MPDPLQVERVREALADFRFNDGKGPRLAFNGAHMRELAQHLAVRLLTPSSEQPEMAEREESDWWESMLDDAARQIAEKWPFAFKPEPQAFAREVALRAARSTSGEGE